MGWSPHVPMLRKLQPRVEDGYRPNRTTTPLTHGVASMQAAPLYDSEAFVAMGQTADGFRCASPLRGEVLEHHDAAHDGDRERHRDDYHSSGRIRMSPHDDGRSA